MKFVLFSHVALCVDVPELNLQKGMVGVVVEYYPMSDHYEDGYSVEGLIPGDTVEVAESQLEAISISASQTQLAG
jgi:Domain of unknown function (DUF4926)